MHMSSPGDGHETFPSVQAPEELLAEPVPEGTGAALAAVAAVARVGTGAYAEGAAA